MLNENEMFESNQKDRWAYNTVESTKSLQDYSKSINVNKMASKFNQNVF